MSWPSYQTRVPPPLLPGDIVQFATRQALATLIEIELAHGRLLCVNMASLVLHEERKFRFRIADVPGEVVIVGRGAAAQSDIVGLSLVVDNNTVIALRRLAGPDAVRAIRLTQPVARLTVPIPVVQAPEPPASPSAPGARPVSRPLPAIPASRQTSQPLPRISATHRPVTGPMRIVTGVDEQPPVGPLGVDALLAAFLADEDGDRSGSPTVGAKPTPAATAVIVALPPIPSVPPPIVPPEPPVPPPVVPPEPPPVVPPVPPPVVPPEPPPVVPPEPPPVVPPPPVPPPVPVVPPPQAVVSARPVSMPEDWVSRILRPAAAAPDRVTRPIEPVPEPSRPPAPPAPEPPAPPAPAPPAPSPPAPPAPEPPAPPLLPIALDPTPISDPWDLGGLLLGVGEPAQPLSEPAPRTVSRPPEPARSVAPEAHLVRGGAGVDAFVTLGGRETLFQLLVLQLRKPRPNRLEIQGRKPLEIVLDGRGGIGSFTGAPTASATADSATIRAERRRALAERLAELGQLAQLDCQLRPGAGEPPMGERAVPLVEAMTQWVDLALTPVGSDPIQRAFESRLFEYPMTHSADDWGTSRLPLDRLQQRFVSDSLASGRTLRDILSFSPLGRPRTWRTLVLLDAMGLLHFEKEPPASGRAMAQGELMDTLRRRHTQGQESHFAALAAHYASHPSELAPALERIVLRYGPASPAAQSSPEARALCEGIVTAAREAHQVLGDRARRIAYRKSVLTPTEVQGAVDLMIGQLRLALMRRLPELVQSLADVIEELDQGALARAGIQL